MIKNLNADNDILFVQVDGYFHAFIIFNENGRLYIFQRKRVIAIFAFD